MLLSCHLIYSQPLQETAGAAMFLARLLAVQTVFDDLLNMAGRSPIGSNVLQTSHNRGVRGPNSHPPTLCLETVATTNSPWNNTIHYSTPTRRWPKHNPPRETGPPVSSVGLAAEHPLPRKSQPRKWRWRHSAVFFHGAWNGSSESRHHFPDTSFNRPLIRNVGPFRWSFPSRQKSKRARDRVPTPIESLSPGVPFVWRSPSPRPGLLP